MLTSCCILGILCTLQLDKTRTKDIDDAQLIILLLGQMLMLIWLLCLKKMQAVSTQQINASIVTAGDYSVMIRGLSVKNIDNEPLIEFSRHYGEVVNAVHISAVGRPIELGQQLQNQMYVAACQCVWLHSELFLDTMDH